MMMAVGKSETVKLRRRRRVERHTPSPSSASSSRSSLPWKLWWRESASSKQKLRLLRFPAMLVVVLLHTLFLPLSLRTIGLNALKEKGGGELRRFPLLRASNKYCCGRTKTLGLFGTFHGSDCLGEAVVGKFQLPLGQCCICYSTKSYMCGINGVGIHIYHRMHGEGKKREERTAVAEERNRQSQNRKTPCALWSRPAMRGQQRQLESQPAGKWSLVVVGGLLGQWEHGRWDGKNGGGKEGGGKSDAPWWWLAFGPHAFSRPGQCLIAEYMAEKLLLKFKPCSK